MSGDSARPRLGAARVVARDRSLAAFARRHLAILVITPIGLAHGSQAIDLLSPGWLLAVVLVTPALGFLARRVLAAAERRAPRRTTVVAGAGRTARELARRLNDCPASGLRVVGLFGEDAVAADVPVLGSLAQLVDHVKEQRIAHVLIALPAAHPAVAELAEGLADTTTSLSYLDRPGGDVRFDVETVAGVPLFTTCETPFADWGCRLAKRASDVVMALLALALAAPILILVAALVKMSSPGPILFRQRRHGLDGAVVVVYKFRTMTVMEDGTSIAQARRDDPRVTRLGRFLRNTSLDELPQLINVLQGRMSVIGPRPHACVHNEHYRQLIRGYMRRHKVKPGLSGWAQVHGYRGETRTVESMQARVDHDLYYLRRWSLWLDLRIAVRTLKVLVKDPNAY